jgi:hypothetical protein
MAITLNQPSPNQLERKRLAAQFRNGRQSIKALSHFCGEPTKPTFLSAPAKSKYEFLVAADGFSIIEKWKRHR